jgi:hypothetical protein
MLGANRSLQAAVFEFDRAVTPIRDSVAVGFYQRFAGTVTNTRLASSKQRAFIIIEPLANAASRIILRIRDYRVQRQDDETRLG